MHVGDRIRQRRKELDISADDLAKFVHVSRATIFRYEKGDIEKMPAVTLKKIAEKLRTTPEFLMGWTEDQEQESAPFNTIAAHIDDDVTDEEMEEILEYIKYRKQRRNKK
ncbi:helix-turn-helix domain-containing protein [Salinicoccus sesuvii]|uniref:Helix-turn-helix domain-containing protein n=1 Tax=Salinicoccus sesuvii TaxID=868281 RepID=A0ABV7N3P9_9STAP